MITEEDLEKYLPMYLSSESMEELLQELKNYPENMDGRMYSQVFQEGGTIYQGDCLSSLPYCNFPDTRVNGLSALILSNTCDICQENPRLVPLRAAYSPVMPLSKYNDMLIKKFVETGKRSAADIENHIGMIRSQKITHMLYLPSGQGVEEESYVRFDQTLTMPSSGIQFDGGVERAFSLSNYGFYLFLFKFSIHFTRVFERVDRGCSPGQAIAQI